jgi:hypothetical protein
VRDGDNAIQALATALDPNHLFQVHGSIYRIDASNWGMMNDAGHASIGIDRVTFNSTQVRVIYTKVATKIHSVQVTPDETFSAAGVRLGASVGTTYTAIQFYMGSSNVPIDPATLSAAGANVWFTGFFSTAV